MSRLIVLTLFVLQALFMTQGFMQTTHTDVFEAPFVERGHVIVVNAKEAVSNDFVEPEYVLKSDQDNLVTHILSVFGVNGWTAVAVARCESGLGWWKVNSTPNEHSVGIFQINLAKDFGRGKHVHWDKVKGTTLEEKEEALKDPLYNVRIAKQIFDDSGWYPWSTYKNGCYKQYL